MAALKAPFPYFGGKRKVASLVWDRLGDVDNFVEPFCGSAAVLLARPTTPRIETINDADCYLANFWRATQADPEAVAEYADWPVNEADLHSRHRWLVLSFEAAEFRQRMRSEPTYYDARVAGWWVWGACCWIGSGWCEERAAGYERLPKLAGGGKKTATTSYGGPGVHADKVPGSPPEKRPVLGQPRGRGDGGSPGRGVHSAGPEMTEKRPQLHTGNSNHGRGVNAAGPANWSQRPQLEKSGGRGVLGDPGDTHRPQLADAFSRGRGVHGNDGAGTCAQRRAWLVEWFGRLRDRLRTVRVCCGDWRRVCDSPSVTTRLGVTGLFLDPPYAKTRTDGTENRSGNLYANDAHQDVDRLVADVRAYCLERGSDPLMRIVLAGYEGEGHEELEAAGWTVIAWKADGGYGNRTVVGKENAARERLWISPHCVPVRRERTLFDAMEESA